MKENHKIAQLKLEIKSDLKNKTKKTQVREIMKIMRIME
jgi:hypothetical protein